MSITTPNNLLRIVVLIGKRLEKLLKSAEFVEKHPDKLKQLSTLGIVMNDMMMMMEMIMMMMIMMEMMMITS